MSVGDPSGRETARRVFAVEFAAATHSYRAGETERSPVYVVTPTGARVNRLFVVGVLTELTWVNDETLRARIADPTGTFVVYAGQYQPDVRAALAELESPTFLAVTGKANLFEPEDGDRVFTSIRPEAIGEVEADTRDQWTVSTAERTIARIGRMAATLDGAEQNESTVRIAREEYRTTPAYLSGLYEQCLEAVRLVAGERDTVETRRLDPGMGGEPTISTRRLAEIGDRFDVTAEVTPAQPTKPAQPGDAETTAEPVSDAIAQTEDVESSTATATESIPDSTTPSEGVESAAEQDTESVPDATVPTEAAEATTDERTDPTPASPTNESESGSETADTPPASTDEATEADPETQSEMTDEGAPLEGTEDEPILDADEREAVVDEFGTEFTTGADVSEPDEPVPESIDEPANENSEEASDLVDRLVATMQERDDGEGVAREELIAAVAAEADADPGTVDEAITEALMDGRCYEPSEDVLRAI